MSSHTNVFLCCNANSLGRLPFYWEVKCLFVIYLMTGGARTVFRQVLKPTLDLHEETIDESMVSMREQAKGKVGSLTREGIKKFRLSTQLAVEGGLLSSMLTDALVENTGA
jgi:hypothetical protein